MDTKYIWSNPLMEAQKKIIYRDDLIYIAGFTDGEGYIGLAKRNEIRFNRTLPDYQAAFAIVNTNKEVIYWLQSITRLGRVSLKSTQNNKHKLQYDWDLRNEEMRLFIPLLIPYLKIKKQQAILVLEYLLLPTYRGKYMQEIEIPKSELQRREEIYLELKELNKKGK